ncbi:hypothetical protein [Nonomuraea angiospora]|uniref:hypothetical protein n=1 Tax=Nonomuraea angiospora TaxID=46172 RepID=UPI0029A7D1C6|nr:hypothetical protein [Nonomuraea angiospora]MDX3106729.1 hypothetical protein [Nonomuraea angiospora]
MTAATAGVSDAPVLAVAPSKALILASVPRGMRRTPDQQAFLRALREDPEVLGLRHASGDVGGAGPGAGSG